MQTGRFVWHELGTVDPQGAKAFYGKLFGWEPRDQQLPSGTYTMWMRGERTVGGMMAVDESHGFPSTWTGYATVPDVDAAAKRCEQLGGKVLFPPTDIPDTGRFAYLQDPQGGMVAAFRFPPGHAEMPEEDHVPVHEFCWDELHTTDLAGARAFHAELFGWTDRVEDLGAMGKYHVFVAGGRDRAGMMRAADGRARWMQYVKVADVDAKASEAKKLGGKVLHGPADFPGMGRFATVADPAGAVFALWKPFK